MTEKIKCPDCDFEAATDGGLRLHSRKHNNGVVKTEEPDPRYATKEDVNSINASIAKLTEILTQPSPALGITRQTTVATNTEVNSEELDKSPIPPSWRKIVDDILGPDFGINVHYPSEGGGFLFSIVVPLEKSNATKDYIDMYKVDIRKKALSYNEGIDGVKRYCELVKRNLQKNNNKLI